eukprot:gene16023-22161_t
MQLSNTSQRSVLAKGCDSHSGLQPIPLARQKPNCFESTNSVLSIEQLGRSPIQSLRRRLLSPVNAAADGASQTDDAEKKKLWMLAIKPPMYSVGFIPVLASWIEHFSPMSTFYLHVPLYVSVLAAILVIARLNLSNDAFDSDTGVDETKPESVVNLTGNKTLVLILANVLLVSGVGLLYYLFTATGDQRVLSMLGVAIACGYVYQGPPFRLSYKGLGEPLCFLAFGLMATPAFFLALQPTSGLTTALATISPLVWTCGLLVGMTTTAILFCAHFHQIEGDKAAGKISPLVRLGVEKGMQVLHGTVGVVYGTLVLCVALGYLPAPLLLSTALSVPMALNMLQFTRENRKAAEEVVIIGGCDFVPRARGHDYK